MHTDDLIRMLATGVEPVPPHAVEHRWWRALAASLPLAAIAMLVTLGPLDLAHYVRLPMFWAKLALPVAVLAVALPAVLRLGQPGAPLGLVPRLLGLPFVVFWGFAATVYLQAAPAARESLLFGTSWQDCPFLIAGLALPTFAAALWALRGLAPTRLVAAGAAAGLLAGGAGALVYTFHCPELGAPFIGVWYAAGILIPAAVGALVGPRLLRW